MQPLLDQLDTILEGIVGAETKSSALAHRIREELKFARNLAENSPEKAEKWQPLVEKAHKLVQSKMSADGRVDLAAIAAEMEKILAPIGKAAKEFTIHCCGHAHIDMNWMWPWQETISVSHDTFATVDKLMDEFPDFCFSQSQASTYIGMEEYCPEIFEMIKKRIKEGRWDVTASMWVEGDKNLASGEILCRHMLYTRRYFKEKFGLPYDAIKIDWECDTFGHCYTLPGILNRGGVTRYYFHRTGPPKWLYWWQGRDGSKVLAFRDKLGYNGQITSDAGHMMLDYWKENGLKDFLYLYGVGDHGGGPTRADLVRAGELNSWPIFPNVLLSTTDRYYSIVEKANPDIPVVDSELNYVFEGCYTSESNVKRGNRQSENVLPEVEAISLIAGATTGFPYPMDDIRKGWRLAMFNQFHDILPGSGIHATYEYAQGLYQEVQAISGAIRTRALRRLASAVDTSAAAGVKPPSGSGGDVIGDGLGAGAGDPGIAGGISARNAGAVNIEPVLVYNNMAFPRTETIFTKVWNKPLPDDKIVVWDETGDIAPAQVVGRGHYWGHEFVNLAFQAKDVPALGYKTYTIGKASIPAKLPQAVSIPQKGVMENEFVRVEVDQASGAIKHLIDKKTGYDMIPSGGMMDVLELYQEVPHGMTAWDIGQIQRMTRFSDNGVFEETHRGPQRVAFRTSRKVGDSRVAVELGLNAGSPTVDFTVTSHWVERGTQETGVPMLRMAFDTNIAKPEATYEIAFGSIQRPANGQEVPALKWADLSGDRVDAKGSCGITMVNADKYGHNADGNTLKLTLIRSSYDPDPLPEMGDHVIRLAITPHDGKVSVSDATKKGAAFNLPMSVVSTDVHKGKLPSTKGFVEVLSPNVMLASIKKAEDSKALIVRLYEVEGEATEAKVHINDLTKSGSTAVETDLMEVPIKKSTAKMTGDTLTVKIPAYGIATVKIG